jgi:ribonuclease P protein component
LGVTVSSKVGNSVVRNRIKRQVREYFRRHREELPQATDYLVIARDSAAKAEAGQLTADLARSFAAPRPPRKS